MVLASFRTPGEFGGLAPLVDGSASSTSTSTATSASSPNRSTRRSSSSRSWYALLTTLFCLLLAYPLAALIAREPEEVPRPAAAARDPAVLEQLPDPHLCVDDHPRAARGAGADRQRRARLVRARARAASLQLVRRAGLPRLRASAVHGAAAVCQPRKARSGAARRGAGPGRERLAALLAHHVPAVAAGRLRRRGAGVHSGARHLRHSRHPGRPRGQPDRQRHQAAVPRDARLAVRQRALDRADASRRWCSRGSRRGSAVAASARRRARGASRA